MLLSKRFNHYIYFMLYQTVMCITSKDLVTIDFQLGLLLFPCLKKKIIDRKFCLVINLWQRCLRLAHARNYRKRAIIMTGSNSFNFLYPKNVRLKMKGLCAIM